MAESTLNLNLILDSEQDSYDINKFNSNFQMIDNFAGDIQLQANNDTDKLTALEIETRENINLFDEHLNDIDAHDITSIRQTIQNLYDVIESTKSLSIVSEEGVNGLRFWGTKLQINYDGEWIDVAINKSSDGTMIEVEDSFETKYYIPPTTENIETINMNDTSKTKSNDNVSISYYD